MQLSEELTTNTSDLNGGFSLTPKQYELNHLLAGPQRHTLIYGGSRSGKTFLLVRAIMLRALRAGATRHALLRLRANAARASLWLDTIPKVRRLCFPDVSLVEHRQDGFFSLPNKSELWVGGLDDKDRVEKILGQEYLTILFNECSQIPFSSVLMGLTRLAQTHLGMQQRAYYDLNPVGTRHHTHIQFVQHRDPVSLRPLVDPSQYRFAFANPMDNIDNLSREYLASLDALPERQRRRFFEGVYQDEIEGALWTFESIEHARCDLADLPKDLRRVVVAVDPSGTGGDEDKRSDNVGIIVVGLGMDGLGYVLADRTCNLPPEGWARVAVTAFHEFKADRIVAEKNFGGDMVRAVIHTADQNVSVQLVNASRGKAVRAEPVSALYGFQRDGNWEKDRVRHVGEFRELEDQMLNFSTAGYLGDRSPDRADALVWAMTEILVEPMPSFGIFEATRLRAQALGAAKVRPAPRFSYAPGSMEYAAEQAAKLRGDLDAPKGEPAKAEPAHDASADIRWRIGERIAQLQKEVI
jgi:phage terminase large subunit-like protein